MNNEQWNNASKNIRFQFDNKFRPKNFNQGFLKISESFKQKNIEKRQLANVEGLVLSGTRMSKGDIEELKN